MFITQIVPICAKRVFSQKCRDVKNEVFEMHFLFLSFLCCCKRNRKHKKKTKWKKAPPKPTKIVFFKVVIQKWEKWKTCILSKNCLTLFVSGREKNAHFRAHYLFWPKCFGPKQSKPGKTVKKWFQRKLPKTKNDTFFEKGVFLTWVKNWVLLTVFLKSCVLLKTTMFIVLSAKHRSCNKKLYVEKQKIYEE